MTKELIERLPKNVVKEIEYLRDSYKSKYINKDETRCRLAGYVAGLRDAGLITERERQILFVYGTV